MASSSTVKAPCSICGGKSVGIFKCEGCGEIFCRKHVNEHRDILSQQLDEIVIAHDTLQQTIVDQKDKRKAEHPLLKRIDKWETDSIVKIQQTAEKARQEVKTFSRSQKETIAQELHDLAERLRKARVDDDYVETDLRKWTDTLDKLKLDVNMVSPSINICENPTKTLICKMFVSVTQQQTKLNETFGESYGEVRIKENGHTAEYSGLGSSDAMIRGVNEYSSGKHEIRFVANKRTAEFSILFGIIPKLVDLSEAFKQSTYSGFGWWSNDTIYPLGLKPSTSKTLPDLKGEIEFEIVLLLDCDNQKISYFNRRTKNTRELNVNITNCPFPWQLFCCLFDIGDCIQLLPSDK